MPHHKIARLTVDLHPLQNIILIASKNQVAEEEVQEVVTTIVSNKEFYNIEDHDLDFDVLVRSGEHLSHYLFTHTGELNISTVKRELADDGLFYFQFESTLDLLETISVAKERFYIDYYAPESVDEKFKAQLRSFIRDNFDKHLETWQLSELDVSSPEMKDHFDSLIAATSRLYVVTDEAHQLAAVIGINITENNELAFQSITTSRKDIRGKGIMATVLQRISNDFPSAVLTAYVVNDQIKNSLGPTAMICGNQQNVISTKKSTLLKNVLEQTKGISYQNTIG